MTIEAAGITDITDTPKTFLSDVGLYQRWFEQRCEEAPRVVTRSAALFADFSEFARSHGELDCGSHKAFSTSLAKIGYAPKSAWVDGKTCNCFIGLRLVSEGGER